MYSFRAMIYQEVVSYVLLPSTKKSNLILLPVSLGLYHNRPREDTRPKKHILPLSDNNIIIYSISQVYTGTHSSLISVYSLSIKSHVFWGSVVFLGENENDVSDFGCFYQSHGPLCLSKATRKGIYMQIQIR